MLAIFTTCQNRQVTIKIQGVFNFKTHQDFRKAYSGQPCDYRYVVDVAGVEAIDSSALGMLLVLREYAGGDNAHVSIINVSPGIREILEVARFGEMFSISGK